LVANQIEEQLLQKNYATNVAKISKRGRGRPTQHKKKAVEEVAKMTGVNPRTVERDIRKKRTAKAKVSHNGQTPTIELGLSDTIGVLIERARINDGHFKVRLDDYVITVAYSPDTKKLVPATKRLVVTPCKVQEERRC
jgi:hypothetical protein